MVTKPLGKGHKIVVEADGKVRVVKDRKSILAGKDVSTRLKYLAREKSKIRYGKKGLS